MIRARTRIEASKLTRLQCMKCSETIYVPTDRLKEQHIVVRPIEEDPSNRNRLSCPFCILNRDGQTYFLEIFS